MSWPLTHAARDTVVSEAIECNHVSVARAYVLATETYAAHDTVVSEARECKPTEMNDDELDTWRDEWLAAIQMCGVPHALV